MTDYLRHGISCQSNRRPGSAPERPGSPGVCRRTSRKASARGLYRGRERLLPSCAAICRCRMFPARFLSSKFRPRSKRRRSMGMARSPVKPLQRSSLRRFFQRGSFPEEAPQKTNLCRGFTGGTGMPQSDAALDAYEFRASEPARNIRQRRSPRNSAGAVRRPRKAHELSFPESASQTPRARPSGADPGPAGFDWQDNRGRQIIPYRQTDEPLPTKSAPRRLALERRR